MGAMATSPRLDTALVTAPDRRESDPLRQTGLVSDSGSERVERRRELFRERVAAHDQLVPGYGAIWTALEATLLAVGGSAAVPPGNPDPMIRVFLDDGKGLEQPTVVTVTGDENECHVNAANLWRSGQSTAIGTGYALSDDLWREHSWGWDVDGRLIETTKVRDRYFGIRLEGDAAGRFAEWVAPTGSAD
jgi:hypothetical protein